MPLKRHPFLIKLFNWEYWPAGIANIPVVLCWLYYGLRSRDLFFFSAVNPVIETGGVFGESKINILRRMPEEVLPATIFVEENRDVEALLKEIDTQQITYPLIAKPDVGERGFRVEKIADKEAMRRYCKQNKYAFLIQEFVAYPLEISVLYHRFPEQEKGKITSLCIKEMLKVKGDGRSSIAELMSRQDRAFLQLSRFENDYPELLQLVPPAGETIELEPIGNHCRGTQFLNGNAEIDERLHQVFDQIHHQMQGMWYGRFDMKCASLDALRAGRDFKVMEFNGIASEPAHIYDPAYPLSKKYRDIFRHWRIIFELGRVQRRRGVSSMTWKEAVNSLRDYFQYKKAASA